jgi:nitrous oxidase accessory protein NosD
MIVNGYGAVIDGRDEDGKIVRPQWMVVAASDVTVRGFTMRYASNDYSIGALETAQTGVQRFRLEDCDVSFAFIDINLAGTTDSEIRGCAIHDAKHLGIRVSAPTVHGAHRNRITANRIYHNDRVAEPDPNADAGGLKASGQDDLVLDGNIVYDNGEKGLWLDVSCFNASISNNRVHDNDTAGIMDETSTNTKINGNAAWANGFGRYGAVWGWGAGILISSSKAAEVWDNTLAWNYAGISVISQDRGDSPGVTGTYVHDNVIVEGRPTEGNDRFALFWAQDWSGPLYATESKNRGSGNQYFYPAPEDRFWRFVWDGGRSTLSDFNTTPGEQDGTYLTSQQTEKMLTEAGVPIAP